MGYVEEYYQECNVAEFLAEHTEWDLICGMCECEITDSILYHMPANDVICEKCYDDAVEKEDAEAEAAQPRIAEAVAMCRATSDVSPYDKSEEYAPTREQYERGDKTAYTPNAYRAHVRHNCTNYDSIIRDLDRYDWIDRLICDAVRERIDEIVIQVIAEANNLTQDQAEVEFGDDVFGD